MAGRHGRAAVGKDAGPSDGDKLSFVTLLPLVLDEEDTAWERGHVAGNLMESFSQADSYATDTVGASLLRHGGTVRNIHKYFSQFESRQCQVSSSRQGARTSMNNVRVPKFHRQDSLLEAHEEGAFTKLSPGVTMVHKLNALDYEVYRQAFMCAQYPKLCVPDPPRATPPPSTPPTGPPLSFSYRQRSLSLLSTTTTVSTFTSVSDAEESALMIPEETLCELLRQAFGLSSERATKYEESINRTFKKKSAKRILAEELNNQLMILENNCHPYYCVNCFVSPYAYDQWQTGTRSLIISLIEKVWAFSRHQLKNSSNYDASHHHRNYKHLLEKLISYEMNFKRGPEHCRDAMMQAPLSTASIRLLKEMGLRYGVGEMYQKVAHLHYLSERFEDETWYLRYVQCVLLDILEMLPINHAKLVITKKELKILSEAANMIFGQCESYLKRVKRLFPLAPAEGVGALIELLDCVMALLGYLNRKKQVPLSSVLLKYTKENFKESYKELKQISLEELSLDPTQQTRAPKLLSRLVGYLEKEIKDYKQHYHEVFRKYLDMTGEAANSFYGDLMADVACLCREHLKNHSMEEVDIEMVSFAYCLNGLDQKWAEYIPIRQQTWRKDFLAEVIKWIDVLEYKCRMFVKEAVGEDKYLPLNIPDMSAALTEVDMMPMTIETPALLLGSFNSAFELVRPSVQRYVPADANEGSKPCVISTSVLDVFSSSSGSNHVHVTSRVPSLTSRPTVKPFANHGSTTAVDQDSDSPPQPEWHYDLDELRTDRSSKSVLLFFNERSLPRSRSCPELSDLIKHSEALEELFQERFQTRVNIMATASSCEDLHSSYESTKGAAGLPQDRGALEVTLEEVKHGRQKLLKPQAVKRQQSAPDNYPSNFRNYSQPLKSPTNNSITDASDCKEQTPITSMNNDDLTSENNVNEPSIPATEELIKQTHLDCATQASPTDNRGILNGVSPGKGELHVIKEEVLSSDGDGNESHGSQSAEKPVSDWSESDQTRASVRALQDHDSVVLLENEATPTTEEHDEDEEGHMKNTDGENHRHDTGKEGSLPNTSNPYARSALDDVRCRDPQVDEHCREDDSVFLKEPDDDCGHDPQMEPSHDDLTSASPIQKQSGSCKNTQSKVQGSCLSPSQGGHEISKVTAPIDLKPSLAHFQSLADLHTVDHSNGILSNQIESTSNNVQDSMISQPNALLQSQTSVSSSGTLSLSISSSQLVNAANDEEKRKHYRKRSRTSSQSSIPERSLSHQELLREAVIYQSSDEAMDGHDSENDSSGSDNPLASTSPYPALAEVPVRRISSGTPSSSVGPTPHKPSMPRGSRSKKVHDSNLSLVIGDVSNTMTETYTESPSSPGTFLLRNPHGECPTSGSVVDITCLLQRLIGFARVISLMLYPVTKLQNRSKYNELMGYHQGSRKQTEYEDPMAGVLLEYSEARIQILNKLKKVMSIVVGLYGDNILAMDLCGMRDVKARHLIGARLVQAVQQAHQRDQIWGCRHVAECRTSCFHYYKLRAKYLGDRFEPVSQQMCVRINNMHSLGESVPSILRQMQRRMEEDRFKDLPLHYSTAQDHRGSHMSTPGTPGKVTPVHLATPLSMSSQSSLQTAASQSGAPPPFGHRLKKTCDALMNVLAYRVNLFCQEALVLLMELALPGVSMHRRLRPLMDFLNINLKKLREWLYPVLFHSITEKLWAFLAKDIETMASSLRNQLDGTIEAAVKLLQVIAFLLKFFHEQDPELTLDTLAQQVEKPSFWLQLYSQSTSRLISLYKQLYVWEMSRSSAESNIGSRTSLPSRRCIYTMRHELHAEKKCFSGIQMVQWLMSHWYMVTRSAQEAWPLPDEHDAREYAERMLSAGIIVPVSQPPQQSARCLSPYPRTDGGNILSSSLCSEESKQFFRSPPLICEESVDRDCQCSDEGSVIDTGLLAGSTVATIGSSRGDTRFEDSMKIDSDDDQLVVLSKDLPTVKARQHRASTTDFMNAKAAVQSSLLKQERGTGMARSQSLLNCVPHRDRYDSEDSNSSQTTASNFLFLSSHKRFYRFASFIEDLDLSELNEEISSPDGSPRWSPVETAQARPQTPEDHAKQEQLGKVMEVYLENDVSSDFILDILRSRRRTDQEVNKFLWYLCEQDWHDFNEYEEVGLGLGCLSFR